MIPQYGGLLDPESVAVIGASADSSRIGHRPLEFMQKRGLKARIYPINPRYEAIDGLQCYPQIADLPEAVDVALVALPAEYVVEAVSSCIAKGVRWVVIFSAGFAEMGAQGRQRERALRRVVEKGAGRTRVLGPNCIGVASIEHAFIGSFSTAFDEGETCAGDVAFASQSGAFGSMIFREAQNAGIPLGTFVSTGNEVDFELGEAIDLLVQQANIKVILGYLEGLRPGSRFLEAVSAARNAGKSVVVLKVGKTPEAAAAAVSHTGSLVGNDDIYAAVFAKYGVIRAESMDHLLDLAQVLRTQRSPRGRRLGIATLSGGAGVLMTDEAGPAGLKVPRLRGETLAAMRTVIPVYGSARNPVDFTAQLINEPHRLAECIGVLCRSDQVDAIAVFLGNQAQMEDGLLSSIESAFVDTSKPLAVTWAGGTGEAPRRLRVLGIPAFSDPGRCVRALADLCKYGERVPMVPRTITPVRRVQRRPFLADSPTDLWLNELQAARLLRGYGITVTEYAIATSADEAVKITRCYGTPVVLKVLSPGILHKSDIGGVRVGIDGEEEARAAYEDVIASVKAAMPTVSIEGVLVSPMEKGRLELIVGVKWDPIFGAVVMVGAGGILAEYLRDTVVEVAPFSRRTARIMLKRLRVWPILAGVRGEPSLDVDAVCDILVRAGELGIREGVLLDSVDMNPVLVRPSGRGAIVVDAKVVLRAGLRSNSTGN